MEEIDKAFCHLATLRVSITVDTMEMVLLMAEILRSPVEVGSLSHYFQGLIHPNGGCLGFLPSTVAKKRFFEFLFKRNRSHEHQRERANHYNLEKLI